MSHSHINIFYGEKDGGYIADIPYLDSGSAFGGKKKGTGWDRLLRFGDSLPASCVF